MTTGFGNMYKKFKDYEFAATSLGDTITGSERDPTTADCLNGIAQGSGESTYVGRGYDVMDITIRGFIEWFNYSTNTDRNGDIVRLLLVWDKQTNATQLNAEDVLKNVGTPVNALRNLEFTHRFIVLKDLTIQQKPLGFGDTADNERVKQPFKIHHRFKNTVKVLTKSVGATVSDINDNSFHIIAYCSRASNTATLQYNSRIRFHG